MANRDCNCNLHHASSLEEAVFMLLTQLVTRSPEHGNGFAVCFEDIHDGDLINLIESLSYFACKDDGFCKCDGNYICIEATNAKQLFQILAAWITLNTPSKTSFWAPRPSELESRPELEPESEVEPKQEIKKE